MHHAHAGTDALGVLRHGASGSWNKLRERGMQSKQLNPECKTERKTDQKRKHRRCTLISVTLDTSQVPCSGVLRPQMQSKPSTASEHAHDGNDRRQRQEHHGPCIASAASDPLAYSNCPQGVVSEGSAATHVQTRTHARTHTHKSLKQKDTI